MRTRLGWWFGLLLVATGCPWGVRSDGAVRVVVRFEHVRPGCLEVTASEAVPGGRSTSVRLERAALSGTRAVFGVDPEADWDPALGLRVRAYEQGCSGPPLEEVTRPEALVVKPGVLAEWAVTLTAVDADGDGYAAPGSGVRGSDCDDGDAARHPGATETCGAVDMNCDGRAGCLDPLCLAATCDDGVATTTRDTCRADGVCAGTPFTTCRAGTFISQAGTPTTDQVCAPCASGSFSTTPNAAACHPWSACAPGTHVASAPSASADRVCAACEPGTFSVQPNSGTCAAIGTCPAGQQQLAPATATSDVQCGGCDVGTWCPGGTVPPAPCPAGTWDDDRIAASACVAWSTCGPGHFVSQAGTATTDRGCAACATGYSTADNASACTPWSACAAGTTQTAAGTSTLDVACAPCATGTWDDDASPATACVAQTSCAAGHFVSQAGTATADRVCAACATGYSTLANAAACSPWQPCAAGTTQTAAGTPTTDFTCAPCAGDTWDADGVATTACVARATCAAGTVITADGSATSNRVCATCPSGFTTTTNALTCSPWRTCAAGTTQTAAGTPTGDAVCTPCAGDTWDDDGVATTACVARTLCAAGTTVVADGSATANRTCAACASGFSTTPNASACTPWTACAAGTTRTAAGTATTDAVCTPCAAGTWDDDGVATTACVARATCAPGTVVVSDGSATTNRTCAPCAGGFSTTSNAAACTTWSSCAANAWESAAPSATADRGCTVFTSCLDQQTHVATASSGPLVIDPDGAGPAGPLSVTCDQTTAGGGWTVISFEDFSTGAPGWSNSARDTTSTCATLWGPMLGGANVFGTGVSTSRTYDLLGVVHTSVRVDLKYYVIDSWDTENARVSVDGALVYDTAFAHGAAATNLCGSGWNDHGPQAVSATRAHATNAVVVNATSTLDQAASDEAFGIDDVRVMVR